ncbi:DNA-methyltransferase [Natronolimnobius baerhuensis]|uniref:Type II methyltransferase n=1 Tax=Natronolimnobius baerhuensis TaxID=253108 RepID=A0A202E4H4_9EURY|nr:site-specific DNA-methyltransferase [Natronolimnobius baerhuensis]OVE83162.1 modification methylase [Natronolimnobius baerhuensis]
METTHRVVVDDARSLSALEDDSVDLVVTSPPYPMIEMWDDLFTTLEPAIGDALEAGDGQAAFDAMHAELEAVWDELERVVVDGGIVCLNVGDATRSLDDSFRVYPNHARVLEAFEARGFDPLPDVLWRKPTNSAAKFMGSGMIPPNAYVTLEHEYILIFRNGGDSRQFEPGADRRYEAAYFWEERNRWFSDVWTDVQGELQDLDLDLEDAADLRERSAAYPLEIPYRLCCMYSAYGDTVLDPFWGTGTTTLAAMCTGRNSVGYELESAFLEAFDESVADIPALSQSVGQARLARHKEFVSQRRDEGSDLEYDAEHYETAVVTKMERQIQFREVTAVDPLEGGAHHGEQAYRATHEPLSLE